MIKAVSAAIAVMTLPLVACSSAQSDRICAAAGGHYTNGTCERSSPEQDAAQEWCETHGGVYLNGQDNCAFGEGGP